MTTDEIVNPAVEEFEFAITIWRHKLGVSRSRTEKIVDFVLVKELFVLSFSDSAIECRRWSATIVS